MVLAILASDSSSGNNMMDHVVLRICVTIMKLSMPSILYNSMVIPSGPGALSRLVSLIISYTSSKCHAPVSISSASFSMFGLLLLGMPGGFPDGFYM